MKNILSLIGAGLVGGLIVVGAMKLVNNNNVNVSPHGNGLVKLASDNTPVGGTLDLSQAAAIASPSVVYIESAESRESAMNRQNQDPFSSFFGFRQGPKRGSGSGVIISQDGYIVTNNHVVDFADEVKVTLTDKSVYKAKVIGTDERGDLAVLKISASGLPAIQKANSENLRIGEWVLAIGYPYDIGTTVTAGIISAKDKKISENNPLQDFIQTDAVVNPGNSGGALVDAAGRLVGINTAIQTHTGSYEGYSFAIPVNMMNRIVDDIIKTGGKRPQASTQQRNQITAPNGQHPRLGIEMVRDEDFEAVAREKDLNITEGVIVDEVLDGSAAQYAGILPNDVIVKIDGQAVRSTFELKSKVQSSKAGDVLKVVVFRNGKTKEIQVALRS